MTLLTKGMGKILKGTGKKIKGIKNTDVNFRKGAAQALKDMNKKGFIGIKAKKIPKDVTYMKGALRKD